VNQMFWRLVFEVCRVIDLDQAEALLGLQLFQFWR